MCQTESRTEILRALAQPGPWRRVALGFGLAFLCACSITDRSADDPLDPSGGRSSPADDDEDEEASETSGMDAAGAGQGPIEMSGAVQKGPFIVGTPVFVNRVDPRGNVGEVLALTEIDDSVGSFSFELAAASPVQILSTGYFYSELSAEISSGTLTLRAMLDLTEDGRHEANINILTHLISDRVAELMREQGLAVGAAIAEAQGELITALEPVFPVDDLPAFTGLSLYEDTAGSAYLLALSASFYKYAELRAAGLDTSVEAQLSFALNQIAADLADDGAVQLSGFTDDLLSALRMLNPREIEANLLARSRIDSSEPTEVPDIRRFLGLCAGAADCMWSAGAPMPVATRGHASVVYDDKILVFGGDADVVIDEATVQAARGSYTQTYEYDPASNAWASRQPMPIGLYSSTAHRVGERVYVFGGYGRDGFIPAVMELDPADDSWTVKTSMPTHRYVFMSEAVNGRVYVIGGHGPVGDGQSESGVPWEIKRHVEIYDPETDTWTSGAPAPAPVKEAASCVSGDHIWIFGGDTEGRYHTSDTWVYDTVSDSWSESIAAPSGRSRHVCVPMGSEFYLVGGIADEGALDALEIFAFQSETWRGSTTYLPTARQAFSASAIGSNLYLFGGYGPSTDLLSSMEILDISGLEQ